ncbi:MAG: hypothetical protein FWF73_02085, partial [Spirochaetes bacterium]|nr:hypothetical protein [Spirochaetota bacterium]
EDTMFKFFPYGEVYYIDQVGLISDKLFFIEGMEFNVQIGYNEEQQENGSFTGGWLEHNYVWTEAQLNNIEPSNNINGDQIFILLSKHYMTDRPQSGSFNNESSQQKMTISDILKKVYIPFFEIPKNKYFISETNGFPYLNQYNDMNKDFIRKLTRAAYSTSFQQSPFYTFINCNGEFYFMTIQELMNQQPVKDFIIDISPTSQMDDTYIKEYDTLHGGMPFNKENYLKRFYSFENAGVNISEQENIHKMTDYKIDNENERLLVHKDFINKIPTDNVYLGIQHQLDTPEYFSGFKNSFYADTNLSYRMTLMTQFDVRCVTGKTVTIQTTKKTQDDENAVEYSGRWLIIRSNHLLDKDGYPYSKLTIAKPKIRLDNNHPYRNNFQ